MQSNYEWIRIRLTRPEFNPLHSATKKQPGPEVNRYRFTELFLLLSQSQTIKTSVLLFHNGHCSHLFLSLKTLACSSIITRKPKSRYPSVCFSGKFHKERAQIGISSILEKKKWRRRNPRGPGRSWRT
ncbi:hypothetical protein GBA52_029087 [Prunus armeniaca]|nr:hypothetical protein GBA52_029087 [Prunus armeniaca]